MKTLILGLGNRIMRDDAVGVIAAELLGPQVDADIVTGAARGLALLDWLAGYDRAIILDATRTGADIPGTVRRAEIDRAPAAPPAAGGAHAMGAAAMLSWARRNGWSLPDQLAVYTVEAADMSTVGQQLSAAVQEAVPHLIQRVVREQFALATDHAESELVP